MNRTARGQVEAGLVGMSRRFDAEGGREAVRRMLEAPEPPTALILCHSEMGRAIVRVLEMRARDPMLPPLRIEILTRLVPSGSS